MKSLQDQNEFKDIMWCTLCTASCRVLM